jgi:hypothetical protein
MDEYLKARDNIPDEPSDLEEEDDGEYSEESESDYSGEDDDESSGKIKKKTNKRTTLQQKK